MAGRSAGGGLLSLAGWALLLVLAVLVATGWDGAR